MNAPIPSHQDIVVSNAVMVVGDGVMPRFDDLPTAFEHERLICASGPSGGASMRLYQPVFQRAENNLFTYQNKEDSNDFSKSAG